MADLRSAPPPEDDDLPEPPRLRALRRLVTALTIALILGVVTVAGALVIRITRPAPVAPMVDTVAAGSIAAPAGEDIVAAGAGAGALILVTRDVQGREWLRLYDAATGKAAPPVAITRAP
jgi:hypothetical protein